MRTLGVRTRLSGPALSNLDSRHTIGLPEHRMRLHSMSEMVLRAATPADQEFCFVLHRAAMGAYVEAIWGWEDSAQRAIHEREFAPARTQIINVGNQDVGSLTVRRGPSEIYLERIEIHPDHQGRTIGTQIIQALLDEGAYRKQFVTLDVLAVNHRARAFYRRLGFREVTRHGSGGIKVRMRSDRPAT